MHEPDKMELVPQTLTLVCQSARRAIYRVSLGHYPRPCLGFLIGPKGEWNQPCFEFAVAGVVMQTTDWTDYTERFEEMESLAPLAGQLAKRSSGCCWACG